MVSGIKGIIFDFDGTLFISSINFKIIRERIIKLANRMELKIPEKDMPVLELIEDIRKLNRNRKEKDLFVEKAKEILEEEEMKAVETARPVSGAESVLKMLKENGIKIGIITRNCSKVVIPLLKKYNIPYDMVLTRDEVKKVKPHPSHIKEMIKKLSLKKEQVIVVGDHPFDIKAANSVGVKSIGVLSGGREWFGDVNPDFVFEDINGIKYLFGFERLKAGKIPNFLLSYLLKEYTILNKNVVAGPGVGIDCAFFRERKGIIGVKTDPITLVGKDIGFYLVNINVNDLVVMGAIPKYLLTTLIFPEGIKFPEIEEIFSQINRECRRFNIKWIGGHTEISESVSQPVCCGTLLGIPVKKIRESKIKKGDSLILIKEVGIEAASIIVREKWDELKNFFSERFLKKVADSIYNPGISIYHEAISLWKNFNICGMHDPTEGGISAGIYELSERYNVGFLVYSEKIKIFPPLKRILKYFKISPYGVISSGCILAIAPFKEAIRIKEFFKNKNVICEIIGEVIDREEGVKIVEKGKVKKFPFFETDEITKI